ncbi:MAG: hypothetical protein DA407_06115 [Bacteroidetes bacterium]|nr:MAG: hypothetical protein DA407_06115 [Bacteroidota bacterium]
MNTFKIVLLVILISFLISCKSVVPAINPEIQLKAQNGDAVSQLEIGRWSLSTRKSDQAIQWFEKSAKQGNVIAVFYLSEWFKDKGYTCAIDCLKQAAESGSSEAQYKLGGIYLNDLHETPKDLALAYKWLRLSEEGETSHASGRIGIFQLIKYYKISHLEISKGQKLAKEHFEKYGVSQCIYY